MARVTVHGFFSLPLELRLVVYRFAFVSPTPIPTSCKSPQFPLSAEFLRTCQRIYREAGPILYAENTFTITIGNTHGPLYVSSSCSTALLQLLECEANGITKSPLMQRCLRSFVVQVRYAYSHKLSILRPAVRRLAACLQQDVGPIQYLRLEVNLDCVDESGADFSQPYWQTYMNEVDGSRLGCVLVLRTWFGVLDVNKGEVEVMPFKPEFERHAEVLLARWRGHGREALLRRIQSYKALEVGVTAGVWKRYEKVLHDALLALEDDHEEDFTKARNSILRNQVRG
ncbi:hypothetical protein QBC34DRAFT_478510 [Podospora aff. communis PSN243]|uniref:Uncharacterized protein n=1 Tax=Podospora aff. communis PSN243 TaxID=3040156 RepID=A0AAV9G6V0_9PEZI|nr:hypothetical protein QBC34DRAFT_478510 [Podospora aff. communis PSN243]